MEDKHLGTTRKIPLGSVGEDDQSFARVLVDKRSGRRVTRDLVEEGDLGFEIDAVMK